MAAAKKTTGIVRERKGKRLTVELSEEAHRKLKATAAQQGLSIREFVLALLKEKGIE